VGARGVDGGLFGERGAQGGPLSGALFPPPPQRCSSPPDAGCLRAALTSGSTCRLPYLIRALVVLAAPSASFTACFS